MKRPNRISPSLLADAIASQIIAQDTTTKVLAEMFGYSKDAIAGRLKDLQSRGLVHWVFVPGDIGRSPQRLWKAGPAPLTAIKEEQQLCKFDMPRQFRLSVYPDHIAVRDWAVAALFGPAHREAA